MSFIKKSVPPPEVKEGEVLTAKIIGIEYPVDSNYKDDQGRVKQQIKFRLLLPNGYECNSWMTYYEQPSDKSVLGALSITYMNMIQGPAESVKDVLEGIRKLGSIYVKCSGFRACMMHCASISKYFEKNLNKCGSYKKHGVRRVDKPFFPLLGKVPRSTGGAKAFPAGLSRS